MIRFTSVQQFDDHRDIPDMKREDSKCCYSKLDRAIHERFGPERHGAKLEKTAEVAVNEVKQAGLLNVGTTMEPKWFLERTNPLPLLDFLFAFKNSLLPMGIYVTYLGDQKEFRGARVLSETQFRNYSTARAIVFGITALRRYRDLLCRNLDGLSESETEEYLEELRVAAEMACMEEGSSEEVTSKIKGLEDFLPCFTRETE